VLAFIFLLCYFNIVVQFKINQEVIMESYIGTVELFAFNFAPKGWERCEGQLLSIADNQQLFSLIGNTYGGDGRTNFSLPNLKGKEPVQGMNYYIAVYGIYPPRA
jgi:microcystin-dependent protein